MLRIHGLVSLLIVSCLVACGDDSSIGAGGSGGGGTGGGDGGAASSNSASSQVASSASTSTAVASSSTGECIHPNPVCVVDEDCCPGYRCGFDEEGEEPACESK